MSFETLCHVLVPLFWLPGWYMVSNLQRRVGFAVGAVAFPFSLYLVYANGLWGLAVVETVAAVIWARGWYRATFKEPERWR